jgi:hypothetical protein
MAIPQFKNCFDSNMGIWSSKTTIKSGGAASSYGRERCFFFLKIPLSRLLLMLGVPLV